MFTCITGEDLPDASVFAAVGIGSQKAHCFSNCRPDESKDWLFLMLIPVYNWTIFQLINKRKRVSQVS